jgi:hypothetical protein
MSERSDVGEYEEMPKHEQCDEGWGVVSLASSLASLMGGPLFMKTSGLRVKGRAGPGGTNTR